jgi:DNA mismatch repair protein MSH6
MCRPKFIKKESNNGKAYLELRGMRHPCIEATGVKFIPNDTILGSETKNPPLLLVTGPNMGGKSTILRQTCIAVIMAQLGCYVPAEKCVLTPVDRVFTRIGASDRILEGKSTFFVEMEEAKNVVEYATNESLVVMDELGRGTSTFDGLAIAEAVLNCIVRRIKCRTLFATHYHLLVEKVKEMKEVGLYYMEFEVDEQTDHIEFKHKFTPGVCPKSFGIQVAKLAGLPVINRLTIGCYT